ncbi:MAG: hypothetical protein V8T10_05395 [Merdibacter sp.]
MITTCSRSRSLRHDHPDAGADVYRRKTRMGRAMRAVSVDEDAAELMGINVDRRFPIRLRSAAPGRRGRRAGWPVYYNSINPLMGMFRA